MPRQKRKPFRKSEGFLFELQHVPTQAMKPAISIPVEKDGKGFESFHVKDPDGFDVQICNKRVAGASREKRSR